MKALLLVETWGVRVRHFIADARIRRNRRAESRRRARALVTVAPFDHEQLAGIARRALLAQSHQRHD